MKKLIVISDWASDMLTCQEFRTVVEGYASDSLKAKITFVASTPSTLHTSFLLSQITEIEERFGKPLETVFFINTDPRLQTKEGVDKSKGADFLVIRLKSGIYICGPNAGFCYSLVKEKIDEIFVYRGLDKGSQFRSRDLYARVAAHLMDNLEDELELEELQPDSIIGFDGFYILHIDNYGNIKSSITSEDMKGKYEYGDFLDIEIDDVKRKARYVTNLFGGKPGELVIYPGSSGKKDNPYLEITIWRHFTEEDISTGASAFKHPRPGTKIVLA
jgi:hypothetical protein